MIGNRIGKLKWKIASKLSLVALWAAQPIPSLSLSFQLISVCSGFSVNFFVWHLVLLISCLNFRLESWTEDNLRRFLAAVSCWQQWVGQGLLVKKRSSLFLDKKAEDSQKQSKQVRGSNFEAKSSLIWSNEKLVVFLDQNRVHWTLSSKHNL